jgi:hypothetical protein
LFVVATQAKGDVLIHQKMFESSCFFVDKLIDMGAKIMLCDPHRAVVMGHDFKSQLKQQQCLHQIFVRESHFNRRSFSKRNKYDPKH